MKKFKVDLISPQEAAPWKRGASNAGYHDLGCAKTFAPMGKAFAEAAFDMSDYTAAHQDLWKRDLSSHATAPYHAWLKQ